MYKVDLPSDSSIENALERRRSAETARRARIFNTRQRVLGLDLNALNQQVHEKKHQQNMERQREKAYDQLREYHDRALIQLDIDEREKQAALHTGLTRYWATHQRAEDSSDADLKAGLKGAFGITIPEGELGPASMKIFQGEGIGEEQRRREQMKMTERYLRTQKEDNERRLLGEKHIEMLVGKELVHQDYTGLQLSALEEECKKAARVALDNYNQALAAERTEKLKEKQKTEERENVAEMWHTLSSDMMSECAEAGARETGEGRPPLVHVDRWKGMSPEQLSAIHREREVQRFERQRQRDAQKIQDLACELQLLKLSREAEEVARGAEEMRREKRIQTARYNMQLAREQHAHQEYLNKKLYTNKPSKDYFHQFNTSSR